MKKQKNFSLYSVFYVLRTHSNPLITIYISFYFRAVSLTVYILLIFVHVILVFFGALGNVLVLLAISMVKSKFCILLKQTRQAA